MNNLIEEENAAKLDLGGSLPEVSCSKSNARCSRISPPCLSLFPSNATAKTPLKRDQAMS